jgi:hypothetical protein
MAPLAPLAPLALRAPLAPMAPLAPLAPMAPLAPLALRAPLPPLGEVGCHTDPVPVDALAALCHAHRALGAGARVAAARRDCAALALSLDARAASALQSALFALSEIDGRARAPRGATVDPVGLPSKGALEDLARGSGLPIAQWLVGPGHEVDPGAITRFLYLYVVRARLVERLDDVDRIGPRAAAARWAEEGEESERGRGDHADRIVTEALGRLRTRLLDRACERAQRAFAATREGLEPPAWPPPPWLALALASDAAAWSHLASRPPTFWADLRLEGLSHNAVATVLHRAGQLQRHAGVTCVPPPTRLALAEAQVRLISAMEAGVWPVTQTVRKDSHIVWPPSPVGSPDPSGPRELPPTLLRGVTVPLVDWGRMPKTKPVGPFAERTRSPEIGPMGPLVDWLRSHETGPVDPPTNPHMDPPADPTVDPPMDPPVDPHMDPPVDPPPPRARGGWARGKSGAQRSYVVLGRIGSILRRLRPKRARVESSRVSGGASHRAR